MATAREFLEHHLQAIFDGDLATYRATTVEDLTLYEWYVTPHRIDGLPFHDFMMTEAKRGDTAGMALDPLPSSGTPEDKARVRFDLANYHEQRYGGTAICSYTLLISKGGTAGVKVQSCNESRILVDFDGAWKVVHVHKSPSWNAPYQAPGAT